MNLQGSVAPTRRIISSCTLNSISHINHRFKDIKKPTIDAALLYITTNCRRLCDNNMLDIVVQYNFDNYVILSNNNKKYRNWN